MSPRCLGATRFENEVAQRTCVPGVATGLAWTPVGGDILFVESARMPGSGKLILTGQLGDVMKESRPGGSQPGEGPGGRVRHRSQAVRQTDIHVHVPAGAIPKDGPSAGVAMFISLASLFKRRAVRPDVAMTGEISLRGLVLPVGGIKEKTIAAARAGIRTVILPARNRRDLEDIPQSTRAMLEFVWIDHASQALPVAFSAVVETAGPPESASPHPTTARKQRSRTGSGHRPNV